jgi:hypothetical protein
MSRVSYTQTFGIIALALSALLVVGDERPRRSPEGDPRSGTAVELTAVELQMSNVNLHLDRSLVLEVRRLRGQMTPTKRGQPITLDDLNSFTVNIDSAKMAISTKTCRIC